MVIIVAIIVVAIFVIILGGGMVWLTALQNTILHKLLKWIVASSISLLAVPITLFIVIISLYPDLTTIDDFKVYKLKSYHNICDMTRRNFIIIEDNPDTLTVVNLYETLVVNSIPTYFNSIKLDSTEKTKWASSDKTIATVDKNSGMVTATKKGTVNITTKNETAICKVTVVDTIPKNIEHILLIDRTFSTSLDTVNFTKLTKALRNSFLKDSSITKTINTLSEKARLRGLLYAILIKSYHKSLSSDDSLHVIFYNGHRYEDATCTRFVNIPFVHRKFGRDSILEKVITVEDIYDRKKIRHIDLENHELLRTNFDSVFSEISNYVLKDKDNNKKYHITFFSDFYHDDTITIKKTQQKIQRKITPDCVRKFQERTKPEKLNLIALWKEEYPFDKRRKKEQTEVMGLIKERFVGVSRIDFIFTNDYNDNGYWREDSTFLEFEEMLDPYFNSDSYAELKKISLYAPISNYLKYNEATCKIIMKNPNKKFRWKIKQLESDRNNNSFWKFKKDCSGSFDKDNNRYFINQWYEEECESLYLSIKLEHDTKLDDLRFVYSYEGDNGNNHFHEYGFEIKNVIFSDKYKKHLNNILNAFMFLLISSLMAGATLFIVDFRRYINTPAIQNIQRTTFWILGVIALLALLVLILIFVL